MTQRLRLFCCGGTTFCAQHLRNSSKLSVTMVPWHQLFILTSVGSSTCMVPTYTLRYTHMCMHINSNSLGNTVQLF